MKLYKHLKTTLAARTAVAWTFTALLMAYVGQPALAGDGRLEINQACAEGGGCFFGDDPGFPVQLVLSGSYVLTSDLTPPADTAGIFMPVNADDSLIDFNGFAMKGPESCDGTPVTSCTGSSTVHGIDGAFRDGVTVRNGTIQGMSGNGVQLDRRTLIQNVKVMENGADGISVGDSSSIESAVADRNNQTGIRLGDQSTAIRLRSTGNGGWGVLAGDASVISDSTAAVNANQGFYMRAGAILRNSTSRNNQSHGVDLEADASVIDTTSINNAGEGVNCISAAAVKGNTIAGNASPMDSDCVQVDYNYCNGNLTC